MIIITNFDAVRFERNGQLYDKNYRARAYSSDKVILVKLFTERDEWKESHFSEYEIDGIVYGTQLETINALEKVIYSGVGGSVDIQVDSVPVDVQHPFPTNGDSVYCKDVDIIRSDLNGFSGVACDLFDDLHSIIKDVSITDPKMVFIHFNRSVVTQALGIGNSEAAANPDAPDFSNVKITAVNSGGVEIVLVDQSTDNTKYTSKTYSFVPVGMNAIKVEFCTPDPVGITNFSIQKTIITAARIISNVVSPLTRISEYLKDVANMNMAVDGSITPVDFIYENTSNIAQKFRRLLFTLTDGSIEFTSSNFGALPSLTNGIDIFFDIGGIQKLEENWQTNSDISETCFDFANPYKDGAYVGRWTFSRDTDSPLYLQPGDKFIVRINDNLTGLTLLQMRLKGDNA